ncbi:MAG: proton-conducting transporter membrane subunit [Deltaproteobacteria bacterium]
MDHQPISQAMAYGARQDALFGGLFCVLLIAVALYAGAVPQGNRRWWALLGLLALLILAAYVVRSQVTRILLLDAAAFVAVAMVWTRGTPRAVEAARTYLVLLVAAEVLLGTGLFLLDSGSAGAVTSPGKPAVALLAVGFGLKLALVPFYFWLPGVAEFAAPMTSALIISVVDMAAFTELIQVRELAPGIFTDHRMVWMGLALLSMYGGALMALAQRDLKRLLAFSTVDDLGYLVLGVTVGSTVGLTGAQVGALSHSLVKVMLFGAVGIAEQRTGAPVTLDNSRGLAARFPASSVVFIVGSLGMIGLPPLLGFAGRWRLYLAGAQYGGPALVLAMVAASGMTLLYYARAIHRVWLGEPSGCLSGVSEPGLAITVLGVLGVLILLLGLFPAWLTGYFF